MGRKALKMKKMSQTKTKIVKVVDSLVVCKELRAGNKEQEGITEFDGRERKHKSHFKIF